MRRDEPTGNVTWRTVAEIVAGYGLVLGVLALLFGFAGGIDVAMPWQVAAGILGLGAGLAVAASRAMRRR